MDYNNTFCWDFLYLFFYLSMKEIEEQEDRLEEKKTVFQIFCM